MPNANPHHLEISAAIEGGTSIKPGWTPGSVTLREPVPDYGTPNLDASSLLAWMREHLPGNTFDSLRELFAGEVLEALRDISRTLNDPGAANPAAHAADRMRRIAREAIAKFEEGRS